MAYIDVKTAIISPVKHHFYHVGQLQRCLRAVQRQCPQPRSAPLEMRIRKPCAVADEDSGPQGLRSQLSKGSNGWGRAADSPQNPACRGARRYASLALVPDPAATILQCDVGHRRPQNKSPDCPSGRKQRRGAVIAPFGGGDGHRGADPTIKGLGAPSTAVKTAQASSSAAMIYS